MALSSEDIKELRRVKDEIEEILADIADVIGADSDYRVTCILRYCGANPDMDDMIWTDDVHHDAIAALKRHSGE